MSLSGGEEVPAINCARKHTILGSVRKDLFCCAVPFPFLDVRYGWEVGECVPAYVRECVRGCVCAFVYGGSASYLVLQCALLLLPDLMGQLIHTLSHDIPYLSVA